MEVILLRGGILEVSIKDKIRAFFVHNSFPSVQRFVVVTHVQCLSHSVSFWKKKISSRSCKLNIKIQLAHNRTATRDPFTALVPPPTFKS